MEIITVQKLNAHLYRLSENISDEAAVHMYLVTGSERAALIDTGLGMSGDLDRVVRSLTDKPVICLVTHCDPDHA
ncbi:MAG: MBL fold metallo-hydrolase, partial [Oscillospiraceae bacterium]|nr:MBL fold metallo-hydrolase [Oscillospiraceae bacterium]